MTKAGYELITPTIAERYLRAGKNFRQPIPTHVGAMAEKMKAGHWEDTGDAILFDAEDHPADGQNRLCAVVKSGCTIRFLVVRGVEKSANDIIDAEGVGAHVARNLPMHLAHEGIAPKAAKTLASVIRLVYRSKNSLLHRHEHSTGTLAAHLAMFRAHRDIFEAVAAAPKTDEMIPDSIVGMLRFAAIEEGKQDRMEDFLGHVRRADAALADDPTLQLHGRLRENRSSKAKLPVFEICALTIIACNCWFKGKRVRCLRWRAVGPAAEPFPFLDLGNEGESE